MYQQKQVIQIERSGGRTLAPKGVFRSVYETVTSPENSAMVKSLLAFAAGTAFLASSWGEILLPPQ